MNRKYTYRNPQQPSRGLERQQHGKEGEVAAVHAPRRLRKFEMASCQKCGKRRLGKNSRGVFYCTHCGPMPSRRKSGAFAGRLATTFSLDELASPILALLYEHPFDDAVKKIPTVAGGKEFIRLCPGFAAAVRGKARAGARERQIARVFELAHKLAR